HNGLAQILEADYELESARQHYRDATRLLEEKMAGQLKPLTQNDRTRILRTGSFRALAIRYLEDAELCLGLKDPQGARASVLQAIENLEEGKRNDSQFFNDARHSFFQAQSRAAEVELELKNPTAARDWFNKAVATMTRPDPHAPGRSAALQRKGAHVKIAAVALLLGGEAEARKYLREGQDLLRATRLDDAGRTLVIAHTLQGSGYATLLGDRWSAAECSYEALLLSRQLAARNNDPKRPSPITPFALP